MEAREVEERFLKVNKKLGILTGVWPYQNKKWKTFARTVIIILATTCYITQWARLIVFFSLNVILNDYPYIFMTIGIMIKLGNYIINEPQLKLLLEGIYRDWRTITSKEECSIMIKYAKKADVVVVFYFLHIGICLLVFISLPFVPPVMDMIKPLNHSRKPIYVYPAYYFTDEQNYRYLILSHMYVVMCTLCVLFSACDSNYIYAVQHACGLLEVSGYRFKHACSTFISPEKRDLKLAKMMHKNVFSSIQGHQRALECVKQIETTHYTYMFVAVVPLVGSLSLSLLRITGNEHDEEWFMSVAFYLAQLTHMFVLTVQGQFVIDSYENVYNEIRSGSFWYEGQTETQKLYVITLRRALEPPLLTAGGFVPLNLKTFAQIVKASVSYYTVMQTK